MRRVVVTGMGLVSPFGVGVEHGWKELLSGRSACSRITRFDVSDYAAKIAHSVPRGDGSDGTFNPESVLEPKELRKIGEFIRYGIAAADEALKDSGWDPKTPDEQYASGVLIGSGIGGIDGIAENAIILKERGPRRISPFFIPGQIINLVSGQVSIRHGLKGPNHAVVTACSTGAHAIERKAGRKRSLGYVTSSYFSAQLGHPVALGLIEGGMERGTVEIEHLGRSFTARLVPPCFLDPKGERLNA